MNNYKLLNLKREDNRNVCTYIFLQGVKHNDKALQLSEIRKQTEAILLVYNFFFFSMNNQNNVTLLTARNCIMYL